MNKKMFTQYQHVMTFKLERSHTGNAVKDLVEYIRRKNISTRNRKSVVYTSFNMYPRKEDRDIMYFESYDFEPHEIPNNLILSSTMSLPYDDEKEYVEITLDDLTDENILKYSKQISGRRQMPTVEVCKRHSQFRYILLLRAASSKIWQCKRAYETLREVNQF